MEPQSPAAKPSAPGPTSPTDVAIAFMTLYSRPSLDELTWWRGVSGYFTPQAAIDYHGIDPINIPASKVTGAAKTLPSGSTQLSKVHVPTNAGIYLVVLARSADDPSWRVARVLPPEQEVGD